MDVAKRRHERVAGLGSNARDVIQFRREKGLASPAAVVRQREPVGFVAHVLNDAQRWGSLVEVNGQGIAGEVEFFEAFGDADHGDLAPKTEFVQGFEGVGELALAAVDHDQLRQRRAFVAKPLVPAVHRFPHARKIVRALDGADVELPVVSFGRFAVAKHHARRCRIRAVDVAVVKALHVHGRLFQAEVVHHGFHQPVFGSLRVHLFELGVAVPHVKGGVAQAEFHQLLFVAALRHHHFRPFEFEIQAKRHEKGAAGHRETVPNLGDGSHQHFGVVFVQTLAEFQGLALDNRAVVNAHEVDVAGFGVADHAVHFDVRHGGVDDGAFGLEALHGFELEPQAFGLFKVKSLGGLGHACFQGGLHLAEVAAQHVAYGRHAFGVPCFGLFAHAGPQAIANVVFEAHAKLARRNVVLGQGQIARPDGVELLAQVEHGVHGLDVRIRPEILAAVLAHLPRCKDPGEPFLFQHDERVGFVVLQLNVVERLVRLDHAVFQQQCVRFGRGDNPLDVGNFAHQKTRFAVDIALGEVARHTLFQVLGLPDVKQLPFVVEVLVHPGFVGQTFKQRLQVFRGRHR